MQIKGKFNIKRDKDQVWSHFWLEQNAKRKRGEEKRKRKKKKRKKKKEPRKVWNLYRNAMILNGNYLVKDLSGFLWILVLFHF